MCINNSNIPNSFGQNKVMKFVIPVGNLTKKEWWQFWKKDTLRDAENMIAELISDYKEDITFDSFTGEVKIDKNNIPPIQKEYWIPNKEEDGPINSK